jgi:hypothetical protein
LPHPAPLLTPPAGPPLRRSGDINRRSFPLLGCCLQRPRACGYTPREPSSGPLLLAIGPSLRPNIPRGSAAPNRPCCLWRPAARNPARLLWAMSARLSCLSIAMKYPVCVQSRAALPCAFKVAVG